MLPNDHLPCGELKRWARERRRGRVGIGLGAAFLRGEGDNRSL